MSWRLGDYFFFQFGKALASKRLWTGIFFLGMWSKVIKVKYLKNRSVLKWLKSNKVYSKGISSCWNNLLRAFLVLKDRLAWSLGNGQSIKIGEDPMVESICFYKLSTDMIHSLLKKRIFFLAQVGSDNVNRYGTGLENNTESESSRELSSGVGKLCYGFEPLWHLALFGE